MIFKVKINYLHKKLNKMAKRVNLFFKIKNKILEFLVLEIQVIIMNNINKHLIKII
jgi:hypothetical protein